MQEREKEYYWIWHEYLLRSPDYQEFCHFIKKRLEDPDVPWPEKFKNREDGGPHPLINYTTNPGWVWFDALDLSFEDWWERYGKPEKNSNVDIMSKQSIAAHTPDMMEEEIGVFLDDFRKQTGREPTIQDVKKFFPHWLNYHFHNRVLLVTVQLDHPVDALKKRIGEIVKENVRPPRSQIDLGTLRKYLRVYDLRDKKVKWKDIMADKEVGETWRSIENKNDRRVFEIYRHKAMRIIENVEGWEFPGEY